jgi:hypothetical protein
LDEGKKEIKSELQLKIERTEPVQSPKSKTPHQSLAKHRTGRTNTATKMASEDLAEKKNSAWTDPQNV